MDISIPGRRQYIYRRHADFYQKIKVLLLYISFFSFYLHPAVRCFAWAPQAHRRHAWQVRHLFFWDLIVSVFGLFSCLFGDWETKQNQTTQHKKRGIYNPVMRRAPKSLKFFWLWLILERSASVEITWRPCPIPMDIWSRHFLFQSPPPPPPPPRRRRRILLKKKGAHFSSTLLTSPLCVCSCKSRALIMARLWHFQAGHITNSSSSTRSGQRAGFSLAVCYCYIASSNLDIVRLTQNVPRLPSSWPPPICWRPKKNKKTISFFLSLLNSVPNL